MYKLSFYVPESHLESVKTALFTAGAGRDRHYDRCCWQSLGQGQFRPLPGSQPYLGYEGGLETVAEFKVEMVCAQDCIKTVLATLLKVHPYEQPAYDVCRILTLDDL